MSENILKISILGANGRMGSAIALKALKDTYSSLNLINSKEENKTRNNTTQCNQINNNKNAMIHSLIARKTEDINELNNLIQGFVRDLTAEYNLTAEYESTKESIKYKENLVNESKILNIIQEIKEIKISTDINCTKGCDVLLDFSHYESTPSHCKFAASNNIPILIGTTGNHEPEDYNSYSKSTPIMWAPNTSLIWNLFSIAMKVLSSEDKDISFVAGDVHHENKKDKPSGTMKKLNRDINLESIWSIRKGDMVSWNQILGVSSSENVRIEHQVLNRESYAIGAINAAIWLTKQKKNGIYSMHDFIKEKI